MSMNAPYIPRLQSCRSCGASAVLVFDGSLRFVKCGGCGAISKGGSKEEAVADWNHRASQPASTPDPRDEVIRELREALAVIADHNNAGLSDGSVATRTCLDWMVTTARAALSKTEIQATLVPVEPGETGRNSPSLAGAATICAASYNQALDDAKKAIHWLVENAYENNKHSIDATVTAIAERQACKAAIDAIDQLRNVFDGTDCAIASRGEE